MRLLLIVLAMHMAAGVAAFNLPASILEAIHRSSDVGGAAQRPSHAEELDKIERQKRKTVRPTRPVHATPESHFLASKKSIETVREPAHTSRIVGGDTALESDYPWMVSLQYSWGHFCGGSLVAGQWVLTAAHCTVSASAGDFFVEVGRYHLGNESETVFHRVQVTEIHNHVCYDGSSDMSYDVSLLKLSVVLDNPVIEIFAGNPQFQPAILTPGITYLTVAGWGNMEVHSDSNHASNWPDYLQHVTVPSITNDGCAAQYGSGSITDAMLCAGDVTNGGIDSCQGDSGGPIFLYKNSKYIQVGVVSWGIGCADVGYPGVYAALAPIHTWISGFISGTDMNAAESNRSDACPLRVTPGLPSGGSNSNDDWMPAAETYNNTDCAGTLFSDSYLFWEGDCICDGIDAPYGLNLNCSAWNFDGGDCGPNPPTTGCSVTTPTDPDQNCTHYSCLDSVTCVDQYVIDYDWIGDGICDLALNCSTYQMDGGDCSYGDMSGGDDYFTSCSNYACSSYYNGTWCVDSYLDWDWIGDGVCDAALDCHAYGFDGGDCDSVSLPTYDDDWFSSTDDFAAITLPTGFTDQCSLKGQLTSCALNSASGLYELTWSQYYGSSCSSSNDLISSFSSATVLPAGTGFLQLGECISAASVVGESGMSSSGQDISSFMDQVYMKFSCDASGAMMSLYLEPTCSVAMATEALEDDCNTEYSCLSSDSGVSDIVGLSMQGNVIQGSCSTANGFELSIYPTVEACLEETSSAGVMTQTQPMGFSSSSQASAFGVCTPLAANSLAASFLYNDILDGAPQLYIETSCDNSDLKFSVHSDSSCSISSLVREMDFGSGNNCLSWTISGSSSGVTDPPAFDPYGVVIAAEISMAGVPSSALDDYSVRQVFYNDFEKSVATLLQLNPAQVSVTGHSFSRRLSTRSLHGGGGLKVTFTITHIVDDPDEESGVNGLVASTKTNLNAGVSGSTPAFDVALAYNMDQSGLSANEDFMEADVSGVVFEPGYEINNDQEFLMSLSAASAGAEGLLLWPVVTACTAALLSFLF